MPDRYEYQSLSTRADAFRQTVAPHAAQGWRVISVIGGATEWLEVGSRRD